MRHLETVGTYRYRHAYKRCFGQKGKRHIADETQRPRAPLPLAGPFRTATVFQGFRFRPMVMKSSEAMALSLQHHQRADQVENSASASSSKNWMS